MSSLEDARRLLEARNHLKDAIHQEGNQRRSMDALEPNQAAYMEGYDPGAGLPAIRTPGGKPLPAVPTTNGSVPKGGLVDAKLNPRGSQFDQMPTFRKPLEAEATKAPKRYALRIYVEFLSLGGGSISDYPVELWKGLRSDPEAELLETYTVEDLEGLETDPLLAAGDAFHVKFAADTQSWQGKLGNHKTSTPSPKGIPLWMYSPNCEGWVGNGGQVVFSDPQEAQEDTEDQGEAEDLPELLLSAYKPHRLLYKQETSQETKCYNLHSDLKRIPTFVRHFKGFQLLPERTIRLEMGIPESNSILGTLNYGGNGTFTVKQDTQASRFKKECGKPPKPSRYPFEDPEDKPTEVWVAFVKRGASGDRRQMGQCLEVSKGHNFVDSKGVGLLYDPNGNESSTPYAVELVSSIDDYSYLNSTCFPEANNEYKYQVTNTVWMRSDGRFCDYPPIPSQPVPPGKSCQSSEFGSTIVRTTLTGETYSIFTQPNSSYAIGSKKDLNLWFYDMTTRAALQEDFESYTAPEGYLISSIVFEINNVFLLNKPFKDVPPPRNPPEPSWDGVYSPPPKVSQWFLDG